MDLDLKENAASFLGFAFRAGCIEMVRLPVMVAVFSILLGGCGKVAPLTEQDKKRLEQGMARVEADQERSDRARVGTGINRSSPVTVDQLPSDLPPEIKPEASSVEAPGDGR